MKRYAFIYNPAARSGKSQNKLPYIKERVEKLANARLYESQRKGDISELVADLRPDFDVFVACGGDGTVREVATQLVSSNKKLGIIPLGTGNDLCKTLGIPTDITHSFDLLLKGSTINIDVGRCNNFIFLNSLGFGFDGLTNRFAIEMQYLPSIFRYAMAALWAAVKQKPFKATTQDQNASRRQELIMVTAANGRVEGGAFWIAPQASITDGRLNLVTIQPINKWLIPFLLPLFLIKKANWIPHIQSHEVATAALEIDRNVEIHADGEVIKSDQEKFSITMIPNGLKVICGL